MNKKIEPTILKGTRNFLPAAMARRNQVMDIIKGTFEQFGYAPIETPILSPAETILGKYGDEGDKLTYSWKTMGDRQVALPYDLTVPFARFVAANYQDLPMPFKRYQIQRVWRAERPQKGRLREFYQCDIDIIGTRSLVCEAEIAKVIVTVFDRLKIDDITIKLNSRRLLNEVLGAYKVVPDKFVAVIRIIDKLDKIGEASVIEQIKELGVQNATKILEALKPAKTNEETLAKLKAYDTTELQTFLNYCRELKVPEENLEIDPTLARGLDYYTGLTFEVVSGAADFGTICAGGRYDDLCAMFSDKDFSGVGVSFGFERIMLLLEELELFSDDSPSSQALVIIFDGSSVNASLRIYSKLAKANIPAEIYLDSGKLAKQVKFADKKRIPLENGKQKTLPVSQMAAYLKGYYEAK